MSNLRTAERSLRQRPGFSRFWCGKGPLALLFCLGTGASFGDEALPIGSAAGWPQLETGLAVDREILEANSPSVLRLPYSAPDYALASDAAPASWNSLSKFPSVIEFSPTRHSASDPQVFLRPQFVLGGGSSESLRSLLRIAGFNVTNCIAPLMKMHSTVADSNTHANVSVSARCSFH